MAVNLFLTDRKEQTEMTITWAHFSLCCLNTSQIKRHNTSPQELFEFLDRIAKD